MRTILGTALISAVLLTTLSSHVQAVPGVLAHPASPDLTLTARSDLLPRDGSHEHGHGGHGAPLTEINETLILQWHLPTPPSYGTHDFDDPDVTHKYPGLMGLHALLMSAAFFVALPIGAYLNTVHVFIAIHSYPVLACI